MKYFDTHAHYNDEAYKDDLTEVLEKCKNAGVDRIINVGYNKESSLKSIEFSNKYENFYAAIGVHPHDVDNDTAQDIYDMYDKNNKKIVAIGEIGFDYAFVKDNKEKQKKLFMEQIELANTLKLPISIHSRDASLDTYNTLKEKKPEYGTLFHCFQPSDDLVRLVLENNYFVAFGGNITFKRNATFKRYIDTIPINQIVIETDCPYLTPEPFRGTRNDSSHLNLVCKKLAEYKEMEEEEVSKIVYDNSLKFFKITP